MEKLIGRLRACSWQQYLGLLLGFSWLFVIPLLFVRDAEMRPLIKSAWLACLILAFAAKEAADAPANWGRAWRHYQEQGHPARALQEAIPQEIRGWFHTLWATQLGFLAWLRKPSGVTLASDPSTSYLRRSGYSSLLPLLIVTSLVDIPLGHVAFEYMAIPEAKKLWLHLGALGLHALAFTVLLGDRHLLGAGQHHWASDGLHIRLGARAHGLVPLSHIASAASLRPGFKLGRLGLHEAVVSPWGAPNLVLNLSAPTSLELLGSQRSTLQKIFLYVDDPDAFVQGWTQASAQGADGP